MQRQQFHLEDEDDAQDDALAPARGGINGIGLSVMFFWAPLATALVLLAWWRA